jgi:hypothetical protein
MQGKRPAKAWADCFGCTVSFASKEECSKLRLHKEPCDAKPIHSLSVSTYAAQLSWWFSHFLPDRFKIVLSSDLHSNPMPILNSIIKFMGLDAGPFKPGMLQNVRGYMGDYNITKLTPLERKTVRLLQLYFRQATADLRELLAPLGVRDIAPEIADVTNPR